MSRSDHTLEKSTSLHAQGLENCAQLSVHRFAQKLFADAGFTIVKDPNQQVIFGLDFPLIISPTSEQLPYSTTVLQEWIATNRDQIQHILTVHGALYFKGFEIPSAETWAALINAAGWQAMPYEGGAAVRKLIVGHEHRLARPPIVTTNESPPSEPIPFHNELAQTPNPPSHIGFYCLQPATTGGATPLNRSDFINSWIAEHYPEIHQQLLELGVRYIRIVPEEDDASSALGRSWKSMFRVKTREAAEQVMTKQGWEWEWQPNGDCKTITTVLPAFKTSDSGRLSFFNQIIAAYTGWIDQRNDPTKAVIFGDGSRIPTEFLSDLSQLLQDKQSAIAWSSGDFVLIDNVLTCHSRQPFSGYRRVLATIANGVQPLSEKPFIPQLILSSGDAMPMLGLGMWKVPTAQCANVVNNAIQKGYRLIDAAADYGNEKECGDGIQQALHNSQVAREDLWVTSKLWNTDHHPHHVEAACRRSLHDLGLDYLDLYLVHFPISLRYVDPELRYPAGWFFNPDAPDKRMIEEPIAFHETWKAMEALVDKELVRNIGICNMGTSQIRDLLSYARIKPTVLQVEMHPYLNQSKLLRFCQNQGIAVTAFSNLGAGSYVELGMATQQESCLNESVIQDIATIHQKTPAQIVLRWGIQRGTAIIPKSTQSHRLQENFELFDFQLSVREMQAINQLNKNLRFNDPGYFCEHAFNHFCPIYD